MEEFQKETNMISLQDKVQTHVKAQVLKGFRAEERKKLSIKDDAAEIQGKKDWSI